MSRLRGIGCWVAVGLAAGTFASSTKPNPSALGNTASSQPSDWTAPFSLPGENSFPSGTANSLFGLLTPAPQASIGNAGQAEMPPLPPLPPVRVPSNWDSLWGGSRQSAIAPLPLPEETEVSPLDKEA
ncbi:MAG: hypothetical protein U0894_09130 [Pirellulales bacterium]